MRIIEITVTAATGFNHPNESYANFKPAVTLKASLETGDVPEYVARELQRQACVLVLGEKQRILDECLREAKIEQLKRDIEYLDARVARAIEELPKRQQQLEQDRARIEANSAGTDKLQAWEADGIERRIADDEEYLRNFDRDVAEWKKQAEAKTAELNLLR